MDGITHFREQEVSTCLSHKFLNPDVTTEVLSGFDWLGTFRDDENDRSVKC